MLLKRTIEDGGLIVMESNKARATLSNRRTS